MTAIRMRTVCLCVLWLALVRLLRAVPQCDHYGTCRTSYPFLPAPPGRVPPCAKPGSTFCEKIEHYPTQLIRYLIERWGYDYRTLLSDESRDDFNYRAPVTYGPPVHPGYAYGPPKIPGISYYPGVDLVGNVSNGGYPDRRYKLPPQFLTPGPYLYTTLLQPTTPYNPDDWWERQATRSVVAGHKQTGHVTAAMRPFPDSDFSPNTDRFTYSRSNAEGSIGSNYQPQSHSRKRRQAANNQLCPTRTEFIMPKAAMNNRGNWMFVVNLNEVDDRYTQLVGTETCTTSQCSGLCSIPGSYSSRCQQQYVQKRLVALEGGGDRLYTDIFWFPHCCICEITQNNG